jgi:quercetin dioxygenase-like cupin family protein
MNAQSGETLLQISHEEFARTVDDLERDGYRLLMIKPADGPREALLQKPAREQGHNQDALIRIKSVEYREDERSYLASDVTPLLTRGLLQSEWTVGRAGMMYRDLIPDRLAGRVIASHIRITKGGPVDDRVHYHKIDFQVIYCLKGAISVVYESQGEPFWLRPGDCVLQPPEIRHRVLEAEAGSEVIELTSPADHETWFDHEMQLPTADVQPQRVFGSQRFVRHVSDHTELKPTEFDRIVGAGTEIPGLRTLTSEGDSKDRVEVRQQGSEVLILIGGSGILAKLRRR